LTRRAEGPALALSLPRERRGPDLPEVALGFGVSHVCGAGVWGFRTVGLWCSGVGSGGWTTGCSPFIPYSNMSWQSGLLHTSVMFCVGSVLQTHTGDVARTLRPSIASAMCTRSCSRLGRCIKSTCDNMRHNIVAGELSTQSEYDIYSYHLRISSILFTFIGNTYYLATARNTRADRNEELPDFSPGLAASPSRAFDSH
jgi:hypothetical protein